MRSARSGRVRVWKMRNRKGVEATLEQKARIVANDPEALCRLALRDLGVALIAMPFVLPHPAIDPESDIYCAGNLPE
jgi:DNA-binding transcriptional LysR family regulator